jgi:protein O-GlcNAc transferase
LLTDLGRREEALDCFSKVLLLEPKMFSAFVNQGIAERARERYDEAFAAYDKALSIKPDLAEAWLGRGNVFCDLKRYDEALAAYDKALSIEPDLEVVEGPRLNTKMYLCKWDNLDEEIKSLTISVRLGKTNIAPFPFLSLSDSPEDQLYCAQAWVAANHPPQPNSLWKGHKYQHEKMRIGYVSADLHKHAVAFLTAELFELHDRNRFSIHAYSLGLDDKSDMRRR